MDKILMLELMDCMGIVVAMLALGGSPVLLGYLDERIQGHLKVFIAT